MTVFLGVTAKGPQIKRACDVADHFPTRGARYIR